MSGRRTPSRDAPLLAWGETLRAAKAKREAMRLKAALTAGLVATVLSSAAIEPAPRLVWNASASAPTGLYLVSPDAWIEPGDMVIARVPDEVRRLAAERRYLPSNVPLVKRVAAYAGDEVCALGQQIFINGRPVAARRLTDSHARPMPTWSGCQRLRGRQVFLLSDNPASFDGRYFGLTEGEDIVGKARLLWRW